MNTQTPEQARQMYEQALALAPDDYFLHVNFESIFWRAGGIPGTSRRGSQTLLRTGSAGAGDLLLHWHIVGPRRENQLKPPNIFRARLPFAAIMRKR